MNKTRLIVLAAGLLFATSASSQTVDEQLTGLVQAWIDEEGADLPQVVKDYGVKCVVPIMVGMPDTAKQLFIAAGGVAAGVEALPGADPTAYAAMFPPLVQCVETLLLGEQIWVWVEAEGDRATPAERIAIAVCLLDAVRPLVSEAKEMIARADDFGDGAETLIRERPDLAGDLGAKLEVCF